MMLLFVRIKVYGKENLKLTKKPFIIVANHQSYLDIPAANCSLPFGIRFLAKAELSKVPVFGFIIRKLTVMVDRKNKNDRVKSMESLKNSLEENISIFIAPEGTRNKTSEPLQTFHDGAFRLAAETKFPILVLTIVGSGKLLGAKSHFQFSPGTIKTFIDEPILIGENDTSEILREKVRAKMLSHLK